MPQASRLEEELKANFPDAEIALIKDSGGTFKVLCDEKVVFDKLAISPTLPVFPKPDEVSETIEKL